MKEQREKKKTGRKTKQTPERERILLQAIEQGLPFKYACRLAAIHPDTFFEWRKTNSEFSDRVEKAEAKAMQNALLCIQTAAKKNWKAAAWLLQRRYAEFSGNLENQENGNVRDEAYSAGFAECYALEESAAKDAFEQGKIEAKQERFRKMWELYGDVIPEPWEENFIPTVKKIFGEKCLKHE